MKGLIAFFREYPILGRIVRLLALFISIGIILISASDINSDYRQNVWQINKGISDLQRSQISVLTRNLWTLNEEAVQLQLDSIAASAGLVYLEISESGYVLFQAGNKPVKRVDIIEQKIPLIFHDQGDEFNLGTLRVCASKQRAWEEAVGDLPMHIAINTMFILLTCGFVVLLFYSLLNRHLNEIAKFAGSLDFDNLDADLKLSRKPGAGFDELDRIVLAFNDMTKRLRQDQLLQQQTEDELRAGREKYQAIYNSTTDALFIHNADDGSVVDVNEAMLRMYKCTRDEALGMFPQQFTLVGEPYTVEAAAEKIKKAITEGPQIFEWQARKMTGEVFWVEVALKYTEFGGDRYVLASVRDINLRKEAEMRLAEEKEGLAVTLRSIGDGVITTDIEGRVVLMNKVAERLTGWRQSDAVGEILPGVFNIVNEKSGKVVDNPVDKVLAKGEIVGLANHTALIAKDGTRRSIADSGAPIMDMNSEIVGVVLVFRDVTKESRLEADMRRVKKLESVGVLAGGIAHDFNNILTAILGNINLAQFDADPGSRTHELLAEAEKAVMRATGLTQQLLTFARGGEPVKKVAVIAEVVRESADFVLRGSNVRINYDFGTDLWPVKIDTGQISQVIQNIVINARDSMPDGGEIKIKCRNCNDCPACRHLVMPLGDYVWINISDAGEGMPPEVIERIFDPYFTTKSKGSGLGLAVSNSIIKKHDGRIAVQSELGAGTSFDIFIPASMGAEAPGAEVDKVTCDVESIGSCTVMVMDDEVIICKLLETMLAKMGHKTVKVFGGREAVSEYGRLLAAGQPPELVIMDLTIPGGMGGREAAKKILALNPKAHLLVSSGYSTDPVMADPQEYGFMGTIVKPYQFTELKEAVDNALAAVKNS